MGDSDVEFEDEWEEVHANSATVPTQAADITINLTDGCEAQGAGSKKRRSAGRAFTKQEREDALQVHRVHALCLLAYALLHDQAASSIELQARVISLLPASLLDAAAAAATSEDPAAANWLPELMRWFHKTFALTSQASIPASQQQQDAASTRSKSTAAASAAAATVSRSWQHELLADLGLRGLHGVSVLDQLLCCVSARRGSSAQLVSLLVAALRGTGFLTRSVWSLEPLPFKPAAVQALARGSSLRAKVPAAPGHPGSFGTKGKLGTTSRKRPVTPTAGTGRVEADGAVSGTAVAAAVTQNENNNRANKRPKSVNCNQDGQVLSTAAAAAVPHGSAATPRLGQQQQHSKRKGDEEFELQLAMAMASTAAEAESRAAAVATVAALAAADGAHSTGRTAKSDTGGPPAAAPGTICQTSTPSRLTSKNGPPRSTVNQSLTALIHKGASTAALKAAAAATADKTPQGFLWQANPGFVPRVWCEVYVGSSTHGSWCHVDGLLGCHNEPSVVEAATARTLPLTYVVACQAGAPKDVTRRYAANFLMNLKWRDEGWWSSTMTALRSTAAHLPRHIAQQMVFETMNQEQHTAAPVVTNHPPEQCMEHIPGTNRPALKLGQQQQQQVGSREEGICTTATATAGSSDAALRAAREDAELSCRADRQAAAPPTTIDGFKTHPLYVLQRHITKYQALAPDAVKLGTHRGEAFYSRKDLHDLHTRERWRREGRDVRASELDKPAKVIKRRAAPDAAAGGSSGAQRANIGKFPGGWGGWQRSNSCSLPRRGSSSGTQSAATTAGSSGAAAPVPAAMEEEQVQTAEKPELPSPPPPAASAAGAEGSDSALLYGHWQTNKWAPPAAAGGKVPKNERGNIEVPPFAKLLPAGTKHINLPGLAPICRKLSIDYAPALTGFDVQGGRMVPRIEGVVVCEEFGQDVVQLYLQREQDKAAADKLDLEQQAMKAWKQLLYSMWTRLQLQRKYSAEGTAQQKASADDNDAVVRSDLQSLLQHQRRMAADKTRQILQGLHSQQPRSECAGCAVADVLVKQPHAGSEESKTTLAGRNTPATTAAAAEHQEQSLPTASVQHACGENGWQGVDVEEF